MLIMFKPIIFHFLLLALFFVSFSESQLSCKDESNTDVDWFIALKYPNSYDFVYLSPNNDKWKSSSSSLSSESNMVALTIKQSYSLQYFYAYYNDEPNKYDGIFSERGHLKGVLNFGESSGYWLIHSVPKFPPEGRYIYGAGQEIYGQSFICVSVSTSKLGAFIQQLLMMQSTVYSHNLPDDFSKDPTLQSKLYKFVNNMKGNITASNVLEFTTFGQNSFVHLGKSNRFYNDLYDKLIAQSLKTSLYVESWIRGEKVNSSCQVKYKVFNVKTVKLINSQFQEHADHSKWAVSTSIDMPFVCIGDINRMSSQFKRGGGSMCFSNRDVWNTFHVIVEDFERCQ